MTVCKNQEEFGLICIVFAEGILGTPVSTRSLGQSTTVKHDKPLSMAI